MSMETPLPAAAAAMTKDEAAKALAQLRTSIANPITLPQYRVALDIAIAALTAPAGVPDGWRLVPEVPTTAIIDAAEQHIVRVLDDGEDPDESRYVARGVATAAWRDMLAAAAPPSDAPGEGNFPRSTGCVCKQRGRVLVINDGAETWEPCCFCEAGAEIARLQSLARIPSPAEQGARVPQEWIDSGGLFAMLCNTPYGVGISFNCEEACKAFSDFTSGPPLAAGRVGVGERSAGTLDSVIRGYVQRDGVTIPTVKAVYEFAPDAWAARDAFADSILAGPVVAGEVDRATAVDIEVRRSRRFHFRYYPPNTSLASSFNAILEANGTFETDHAKNAEREALVYADTAKGNGNGN